MCGISERLFSLSIRLSRFIHVIACISTSFHLLLNNIPLYVWIRRRNIHLLWTQRKNLSTAIDSPWWTERQNFTNNKSLEAICWQGLLMCFAHQEELQTELWASHTMSCLLTPSVSTNMGEPCFPLSTKVLLRPAHYNQNCTIWIPQLHKRDLIGNLGQSFQYKRWSPFSLSGT